MNVDTTQSAGVEPVRNRHDNRERIERRRLVVDGAIQDALREALTHRPGINAVQPILRDVITFATRKGKRIRPLLFLEGRAIFEGRQAASSMDVRIAAAIELMHVFILIHDDIIDRSDDRRGLPSMHRLIEQRLTALVDRSRVGRDIALVLGDILFAMAQQMVLDSGHPQSARIASYLMSTMRETGIGEIADIVFGTQDLSKVLPEDIASMYHLKTTRYTIECPLSLAAIASGREEPALQEISHIAKPAGLAFQILNDLKAFERFEVSDADIPDDIIDGKKTAIMRRAFDLLDDNDRSFLQICVNGLTPTEATVTKIRELILKSGALQDLRAESRQLYDEALARIESSMFNADEKSGIKNLFELVQHSLHQ